MRDVQSFFMSRSKELDNELDSLMEQWETLAERKPFLHPEEYEALMKKIGDQSQSILDDVRELRVQITRSTNLKPFKDFTTTNSL